MVVCVSLLFASNEFDLSRDCKCACAWCVHARFFRCISHECVVVELNIVFFFEISVYIAVVRSVLEDAHSQMWIYVLIVLINRMPFGKLNQQKKNNQNSEWMKRKKQNNEPYH